MFLSCDMLRTEFTWSSWSPVGPGEQEQLGHQRGEREVCAAPAPLMTESFVFDKGSLVFYCNSIHETKAGYLFSLPAR